MVRYRLILVAIRLLALLSGPVLLEPLGDGVVKVVTVMNRCVYYVSLFDGISYLNMSGSLLWIVRSTVKDLSCYGL
jgi:hypothetical protein